MALNYFSSLFSYYILLLTLLWPSLPNYVGKVPFQNVHSKGSFFQKDPLTSSHANGSQLRASLPPREQLAMSGDIFGYHDWGTEFYLQLMGRGQRCCWTSYSAQNSLPKQRMNWPQNSVVLMVTNPSYKNLPMLQGLLKYLEVSL